MKVIVQRMLWVFSLFLMVAIMESFAQDLSTDEGLIYSQDFESTPDFSLPEGWLQENQTSPLEGSFVNGETTNLGASKELEGWTVLSLEQLTRLGDNRLSVPEIVSGKSVYAESDNRGGLQIQYLYTPVFDCSDWFGISLEFDSNYTQNQDNLAFIEYTLQGDLPNGDPNKVWLPIVYWADSPEVEAAEGEARAFFENNGLNDDSYYPYLHYIGADPTYIDYSSHIIGCINDDQISSKKTERFDLPLASGQSTVQIRFFLGGGGSWYWGIDHFQLLGVNTEEETPLFPPELMPKLTLFDCNSPDLITLVPGGFTGLPAGTAEFGTIPGPEEGFTDGTGITITVDPGEVQLILFPAVEVGNMLVMISASVQSTAPGASLALAGLDSSMDGSIATNIPANSDIYMESYHRMILGFNPKGPNVMPVFQVANLAGTDPVQVYLDNIEVFTAPTLLLDLLKHIITSENEE